MPTRLTRIDELTRPDHTFLDPADVCFYLGEYTARAGYSFSATNDLIQNLKKPMDRKGKREWKYKEWAIARSAEMLREAVPEEWLGQATFIPIPPSKTKDHDEYDDRLIQILQKFGEGRTIDVRELLAMTESFDPAHLRDDARSVAEIVRRMKVDDSLMEPAPQAICIFDDVLTTGAHFKAAQMWLKNRMQHVQIGPVPIVGLFLARRAPEASLI